jgi:phosphate transport system substrate-binding protein
MKLHTCILISFVLVSAFSCKLSNTQKEAGPAPESSKVVSGSIKISGAFALYPLAQAWATEYCKLNPGVQFTVEKVGTGLGLDCLRAGTCQLAMISRNLTPEEHAEGMHQIPVGKDAVVLIVNKDNPYIHRLLTRGIDPQKLQAIFTGDLGITWGEVLDTSGKEKLKVFTRADISGAAEIWANFIWKTQTDLKGNLVTGDEEMIKQIQENKYGIGYCNLNFAYDRKSGKRIENIQVVPLDLDFDASVDRKEQPYETVEKIHRAIWLGLYPKQLCRSLSFVVGGNTEDPVIMDFLNWALSQGDSCVKASGFCELTNVEKQIAVEAIGTLHKHDKQ